MSRRPRVWLVLLGLLADWGCTDDGPKPPDTAVSGRDADGDGWFTPSDCDDGNGAVHPEATETCDGRDEDCDGVVDNGLPLVLWFPDADGDGWGVSTGAVDVCTAPGGYAAVSGDCDDTDAEIYPEALDLPGDGIDADCDGDYTCETLNVYPGGFEITGDAAGAMASEFCANYNAVEDYLSVYRTSLSDLSDLSCVCSVGSWVGVAENDNLQTLTGLDRLVVVEDRIVLGDCPNLSSLDGLQGVQRARQDLVERMPLLCARPCKYSSSSRAQKA